MQTSKPISEALRLGLTAHRTAALQLEMTRNSTVSLRAVVQKLVTQSGLVERRAQNSMAAPLRIAVQCLPDPVRNAPDLIDSPVMCELAQERNAWATCLTLKGLSLSTAIGDLEQSDLLELLAVVTAMTLDATEQRDTGAARRPALLPAEALSFDLCQTWTASSESYFGHVSKALILDAVGEFELDAGPLLSSLKKAEPVIEAEKHAQGKGGGFP